MTPRSVAKIMAQSSDFDTRNIAVGDSKLGLTALKVRCETPGEIRNA